MYNLTLQGLASKFAAVDIYGSVDNFTAQYTRASKAEKNNMIITLRRRQNQIDDEMR